MFSLIECIYLYSWTIILTLYLVKRIIPDEEYEHNTPSDSHMISPKDTPMNARYQTEEQDLTNTGLPPTPVAAK